MNKQPVSYLQSDARWGGLPYTSTGDKSQTIKSSGCGPTCAAMIAATYMDPAITPKEACAWAVKHGYRHATQGTTYSFFAAYGKMLGLEWAILNGSNLRGLTASAAAPYHAKALAAIRAGKPVICCMGPGNWTSGGHYILWWKEDNGTVYINDPLGTSAKRTKNTLALLQAEVKYYFVCAVPEEQESEEEDMVRYAKLEDIPAWGRPTIEMLLACGALTGVDDKGTLDISHDMLRGFVIQERKDTLRANNNTTEV